MIKKIVLAALCLATSAFGQAVGGGGVPGAGGGGVSNPFSSTTIAEYKLGGLTGTTAPDSSSNGYTGTFGTGGNAPTAQPYGVVFNGPFGTGTNYYAGVQWINLPAAMPDYGSFVANICYDPGPQAWFPQLPASAGDLLGADWSQASRGHQLWVNGPNAVSINAGYGVVTNGSFGTTESSFQGGCGVLIYARDTSDHIYWNGVEVQYSAQSSASATKPTNGYTIGGVPNGFNRGFTGVIRHVMFFSGVLTSAQLPAIINYSNTVVSTYPGLPQPVQPTSTYNSQLMGVGDSLMCGWNGTSCAISPFNYISTNTTYTFYNFGVGKQLCEDIQAFSSVKQNIAYSANAPIGITAVLCGTNNINNVGQSAQTVFNREMALVGAIKAANPSTRVLLFSKYSSASAGSDTKIETLAQLERAGASQYGYNLFDITSIPQVGGAGTYSGGCFIDTVHPTQACVQTYVSPVLSNKINSMDGAGPAKPTAYASNAVTLLPADNYSTITPTAAATATLPECLGMTGGVYQIFNSSAGANTITVSGAGSETITGSNTIAQNATGRFLITVTSTTAGGCGWQRIQ